MRLKRQAIICMLNIQQQFENALFDVASKDLAFISSPLSQQRFNIYRQTVFESLRHALEITYPGMWQLLGKTCADNIARYYCSQIEQLPKSGCLDDWGETFPTIFELFPSLN